MATPQEVLQGLIDSSEEDTETVENQISQVDALISDLEEKATAIEDGQLNPIANQLSNYLDSTKAEQIRVIHGGDVQVVYGSDYNNLADIYNASITDWKIIDATTLITVYTYQGTGWDGDTLIKKFIADWQWGHDYLIHPLTTFDGNYGLYPNISSLNNAKSTLQGNKSKIQQTAGRLEDYV